jgi:hypothetical protein
MRAISVELKLMISHLVYLISPVSFLEYIHSLQYIIQPFLEKKEPVENVSHGFLQECKGF